MSSYRQRQKKFVVIAASLGAVLIIAVGWYFLGGLKTRAYKHPVAGFSVRYPARWSYKENFGGAAVVFYSPKENIMDVFQESVNIVIQDISATPMSLKKYTQTAIRQMEIVFGDNFIVDESVPARFAGLPGHRLVFLGKGPGVELRYLVTWTIDGSTAYQMTYTAMLSRYDKYLLQAKQMIRSFKRAE